MKKISQQEFNQLKSKRHQRFNIIERIKVLKKGEGVIISKYEWKLKTSPLSYVATKMRQEKKPVTMKTLSNGWALLVK